MEERKQEVNIEVIFEIIKDNYNTFNILSKEKNTNGVLLEKLLKTGIIDLI